MAAGFLPISVTADAKTTALRLESLAAAEEEAGPFNEGKNVASDGDSASFAVTSGIVLICFSSVEALAARFSCCCLSNLVSAASILLNAVFLFAFVCASVSRSAA